MIFSVSVPCENVADREIGICVVALHAVHRISVPVYNVWNLRVLHRVMSLGGPVHDPGDLHGFGNFSMLLSSSGAKDVLASDGGLQ
ncbi:hypothetical protein PF010_g18169 [Phytophthora fragariae]|uniref:Uncharacterized protein n=1 Tax=Phytophthora fragariae TaxID=53985 RepID=A0A6A4CJD8_9STRA|nr:hypothetical protein PF010_g18169 [Phytophthora fragariae]KAE9117990.1 hypothetical protein PF006_g18697 [Phytophthora fragariae]KAE9203567.1 hypothetical protein PF002_g20891 [Phytophthora fragariae]KAE9292103.1 hypothetical protein PF001_g18863 [Phytophthora fragariae]